MIAEGQLYIVATPIGNLGDITLRAITVLKEVALIAAEDTRQSKRLLTHYGITTQLTALHAHNERHAAENILLKLRNKQAVAYITDAGTPLISDPGANLVEIVRQNGFRVIPIPGPCAAIAALSVSGFTQPQFYFEGFLPTKSAARKQRLAAIKDLTATLVFYEAPHRILDMLADSESCLGQRKAVIARELTKKFETILEGSLPDLYQRLSDDPKQQLGEFVVLVAGNEKEAELPRDKIISTLTVLMKQVPTKQAVALTSELLAVSKNEVYDIALDLKRDRDSSAED